MVKENHFVISQLLFWSVWLPYRVHMKFVDLVKAIHSIGIIQHANRTSPVVKVNHIQVLAQRITCLTRPSHRAISHTMWNVIYPVRPTVLLRSLWTNPVWNTFNVSTARQRTRNVVRERFSIAKLKRVNPVRKLTVHMAVDVRILVSNIPGPARRNAKGSFLLIHWSQFLFIISKTNWFHVAHRLPLDISNAKRASTPLTIAPEDCITTLPDNDVTHQPMPNARLSPPKRSNSETLKLFARKMAPNSIHTFWIAHHITYAGTARHHCKHAIVVCITIICASYAMWNPRSSAFRKLFSNHQHWLHSHSMVRLLPTPRLRTKVRLAQVALLALTLLRPPMVIRRRKRITRNRRNPMMPSNKLNNVIDHIALGISGW